MGWLDHSTNNIILDAVLTDYGRQKLATASGAFNISKFSLADDEVDYRMIKKYGRAVGKEKIEKNTPVFEALTNQNIAMKYPLVSRSSAGASVSSIYMTYLKSDTASPTFTANVIGPTTVSIKMFYNKSTTIPREPVSLVETKYTIKVPDRFLFLTSAQGGGTLTSYTSVTTDPTDPNRIARYQLIPAPSNPTSIAFNVSMKAIDNAMLSVYGKRTGVNNQRVITTYISVVGDLFGSAIDIPVTYTADTTS